MCGASDYKEQEAAATASVQRTQEVCDRQILFPEERRAPKHVKAGLLTSGSFDAPRLPASSAESAIAALDGV